MGLMKAILQSNDYTRVLETVVRDDESVIKLFAHLIQAYAEQSGRYCQDILEDIEMTMIEEMK